MRPVFTSALLLFAAFPGSARADMDQTGGPRPDLVARALNLDISQMATINAQQAEEVKAAGLDVTCLCPTCPHRTIYDCDCGWAQTNKRTIEAAVAKGMSRAQIVAAYRRAYGDTVLAMLPNEGFARAAWMFPLAMGAGGLALVFVLGAAFLRRSKQKAEAPPEASDPPARSEARKELMRELEEMD